MCPRLILAVRDPSGIAHIISRTPFAQSFGRKLCCCWAFLFWSLNVRVAQLASHRPAWSKRIRFTTLACSTHSFPVYSSFCAQGTWKMQLHRANSPKACHYECSEWAEETAVTKLLELGMVPGITWNEANNDTPGMCRNLAWLKKSSVS